MIEVRVTSRTAQVVESERTHRFARVDAIGETTITWGEGNRHAVVLKTSDAALADRTWNQLTGETA